MRAPPRAVPRYLWPAGVALGFVLGSTNGDAAPANVPIRHARVVEHTPRPIAYPEAATSIAAPRPSWVGSLPAIEVRNRNTNARAKVRLYADDGALDRDALRTFMRVAASSADLDDGDGEVAEPLDPRLVQLAFRAAHHFNGAGIVIVSATRKGSHGKHGSGEALDFQLDGVKAGMLAAYARTYPRAGVGIYTHPRTQFVHVDVRDRSYHWIDASPPGVTWREGRLKDPTQERRDASYAASMDLPETATR